jgi:hypothetical protein
MTGGSVISGDDPAGYIETIKSSKISSQTPILQSIMTSYI